LNSKTLGFAADTSGEFIWSGDIVTLSNPTNEKLQMVTAMDVYKNCKLAWGDKRLDASGIYAQDINPSGQLGQPVIPVELISFNVDQSNGIVLLNWITASETNNRGFEIQKKSEDRSQQSEWEKIGFVVGFGTTTEPKLYSFIDDLSLTPNLTHTLYYRLKQIDFDGSFNFSDEVSIEINLLREFSLGQNYPNPFNPSTKISWQTQVGSWQTLKIYDLLGNEVATLVDEYKPAGKYEVEFNVNGHSGEVRNLTSGIYYYQFQAGEFTDTKKMILLK
jgi:hypothetical protein